MSGFSHTIGALIGYTVRLSGAAGGHAHVPPRHIGRDVSAFGIEEEFFLYDRHTGVRALNGLRPWLPVLTALGVNSPLWRGQDSGFASWRAIHYSRWMASGPPPHFEDTSDYEARVTALLESDVVFDRGCLNWLDDRLFDPSRCASLPAADVVWGLFAHVRHYFADADEESFVRAVLGAGRSFAVFPHHPCRHLRKTSPTTGI